MTSSDEKHPVPGARELDLAALKALAHPLRVQIFEILSQYGPQTASGLGSQLGESSGSTSYHLRQLARHGLIRDIGGKGSGRERWWERMPGSVGFGGVEVQDSPASLQVSRMVMREMQRHREQQFERYFLHDLDLENEQWQDASMIATANLRLTASQLAELNAGVMALAKEIGERYRDQEGDDVRPVSMHVTSYPLPPVDGESS